MELNTLPHSIDAERSVLGAIIVSNGLALDVAGPLLTKAAFYRDAHARIFTAMVALYTRRIGVDFTTLKEELKRTGELDEVGGPSYVSSLADGMPRSVNVEYYAGIVKEKALLRGAIFAANKVLSDAYAAQLPSHDIIQSADREFLALQTLGLGGGMVPDMRGAIGPLMNDIQWRMDNPGKLTGVTTGIPKLDRETNIGFQAGDFIIVGARPSMGKTALTLNMATWAALGQCGEDSHPPVPVLYFSFEMGRKQLHARILSTLSQVPMTRLQSGYLSDMEHAPVSQGMERMAAMPLYIDDVSRQSVLDIRAKTRRMQSEHGIGLMMLDYIQLVPGSLENARNANRTQELTDISRRLKELAMELQIPVVALSQLSRAGKGRQDPLPRVDDLRECGSLEQDADVILLLYRKNHSESGKTACILAKQRNGPTGTVNLDFDRDTQTMREWTKVDEMVEAPPLKPPKPPKRKPPSSARDEEPGDDLYS